MSPTRGCKRVIGAEAGEQKARAEAGTQKSEDKGQLMNEG